MKDFIRIILIFLFVSATIHAAPDSLQKLCIKKIVRSCQTQSLDSFKVYTENLPRELKKEVDDEYIQFLETCSVKEFVEMIKHKGITLQDIKHYSSRKFNCCVNLTIEELYSTVEERAELFRLIKQLEWENVIDSKNSYADACLINYFVNSLISYMNLIVSDATIAQIERILNIFPELKHANNTVHTYYHGYGLRTGTWLQRIKDRLFEEKEERSDLWNKTIEQLFEC